MPDPLCPDDLRAHPMLADLSEDVLEYLCDVGTLRTFADGERVVSEGQPAEQMFFVLSGDFTFRGFFGGTMRSFSNGPGSVTGRLPFSRMETYRGDGTARGDLKALEVHQDQFYDMLGASPELGQRLVGAMSDRVRENTKTVQQNEKLTALGKLSAGLAHELNNPASAARRAATSLRERFAQKPEHAARLVALGLVPEQVRAAYAAACAAAEAHAGEHLSTLALSAREDDLADWLEGHGAADPYGMANTLADAALTPADLDRIIDGIPEPAVPDLLVWIEGHFAAESLLAEIADASARVAELVGAIKEYSHMDQTPEPVQTSVRDGLDSTLTMLAHAARKKSVEIERHYGDLPPIAARPGELNQVWTNLLDNAIDAAAGTVSVRTTPCGDTVEVEIEDDGAGIPDDVRDRIFEPFFTTKAPGKGTGLGLDIVRRIVRQHGGEITVETSPGRTLFRITLPVAGPLARA
jgi:signal transduction histidine kinase